MNANGWLRLGMIVLFLLTIGAVLAPVVAPYPPNRQDLDRDLVLYSSEHPLGTDKLGRDILSRVIYGGRISLLVGLATVIISASVGVSLGAFAGYAGGWADQLLMRLIFPGHSARDRFHRRPRTRAPSRYSRALFDRVDGLRPSRARRDSYLART
jgi:ABC-type dipeptide/oligopeptide/nickel transport system permease subunit